MKKVIMTFMILFLFISCSPNISDIEDIEADGAYCLPYTPKGQVVYDSEWTGEYPEVEKFDGEYNTATFGLGCFWGPAARFSVIDGVLRTRVGYSGGNITKPSYDNVGMHIEVIEIDYDPKVISYEELVNYYFMFYDGTERAFSQRVKSVIFYRTIEEKELAEKVKGEFEIYQGKPIYTEVDELKVFYLAESKHQLSYLKKEVSLYKEISQIFETEDKQLLSILASKLNGYIAGYGDDKELAKLLKKSGLSEESRLRMVEIRLP